MVSSKRSRRVCLAATSIVVAAPSTCTAFRVGRSAVGQVRVGGTGAARCGTRVSSTVDFERRGGIVETTWSGSETLDRRLDTETVLLEPPAAVVEATAISVDAAASSATFAAGATAGATAGAAVTGTDPTENPPMPSTSARRKKSGRKGKAPEIVLEGDVLVNTPKMVGLVWSSLALNALYLVQALATISSPIEALWTAVGGFVGYMIADLVSGVFHWSVDNYGDGNTPVFGAVIEAFQGHHGSPWTITHRPFENNVHKIAYAVLPLLALLRLVNPGPAGVALGVTFLVGSLMSNEFHRFAHMTAPSPLVLGLQKLGVTVSRKEHGQHHASPFEEKYCIVTGICNGPLDHFRVFRFLERLVYEVKGVEPIAWKLDPSVKEVALNTGWSPFSGGAAAATRVEDNAS